MEDYEKTKTSPDDSAFAAAGFSPECGTMFVGGLSKREMFAAMFLQGIINREGYCNPETNNSQAIYAVKYADALIKVLNEEIVE